MTGRMLHSLIGRIGSRTTLVLALAAFLLAGFSFAESGSAAPLAWDYATVLTVGSRIGIGTETPDANTVIEARRSDTTDTMIKSRHLTKGAYFQTQSGINWAGYNMLNAAGATATYFGYRGSTQFRIYDSLAAEDRLMMDAAGTDNGNIYLNPTNTGDVGIGTTTLSARLHVETASGNAVWAASNATTGTANGVYAVTYATAGSGVYGIAGATTGGNIGVYGRSNSPAGVGVYGYNDQPSGIGILGIAPATTGNNYGILGRSDSTSGVAVYGRAAATAGTTYGVYGRSDSTDGAGVYGYSPATTGFGYGVLAQSAATSGRGLMAWATSTTGETYGVWARSDATDGRGMLGWASASTGTTYGVYGKSDSTEGSGVYGYAPAASGSNYGVRGESSSTGGHGVLGFASATSGTAYGIFGQSESTSGLGVYGVAAASTGTNYGVYGRSLSASGYGVYYQGGLGGTGTKSAIVETENYGWRHLYAVESPQNWFEDFGQAALTAGEAVVSIEAIFAETVNLEQEYHVFLTPLGDCPLYVADKTASSFTVRAHGDAGCDIAFDYRIIAPRLDYEDLRLKEAEDPEAVAATVLEAAR